MFGSIRLVMVGLLITGIAGAGVYVMKLRSDNAILKANQVKLEEAVSSQKELIVKQQNDFKEILAANKKMNELVSNLKKDLDDLGQSLVEGNTRHSQLTSNLQYLNEREENIQNQINSIVSEMDRYVAQEKDVVFNQSIDLKIQDLKSEQYLLDDKLDDNNTAITTIFGNIQVLKNKEKQINEDINKVEQLEGDYQAYQYLLKAIQRD